MAARRFVLVLILITVSTSMGAGVRTENFVVDAPTAEIAQKVGEYAEHYRKEKAQQWLGQEMPPWNRPCPITVRVTNGGAGGATSFVYSQGQVLNQEMNINGSLERILNSVLPHEITHTVFAYNFRRPVPRWADEGGSVLSEDEPERIRHDQLVRQILNTPGRAIPLRRLFALTEYPKDVMCLYAEGFSVTHFLVSNSDRQTFLAFIGTGMRDGWDNAVRKFYHYESVDDLEQAWLTHLRNTKRQQGQLVSGSSGGEGDSGNKMLVRLTAPPVQPLTENPYQNNNIVRGKAPEETSGDGWNGQPRNAYPYPAQPSHGGGFQQAPPGSVTLGTPQGISPQGYNPPPAQTQLGAPIPLPLPPGYGRK